MGTAVVCVGVRGEGEGSATDRILGGASRSARLDKAVHADDAAGRTQSLDELAKNAGKSACWFADALRR